MKQKSHNLTVNRAVIRYNRQSGADDPAAAGASYGKCRRNPEGNVPPGQEGVLMDYQREYLTKLRTPEEAVECDGFVLVALQG